MIGLNHLFTPSGIHLTSLLLLLWPLSLFFKQKADRLRFRRYATLALCFLVLFLPGLYPLKRLAILRWAVFLIGKFFHYKDYFIIFLLWSFLDIAILMLGTFYYSPGSFVYSFLFVGTILATKDIYPKMLMCLALVGAQIIISFFQQTPLAPLGVVINFILTLIFEFLYPLMFCLLLPLPYFEKILEKVIGVFYYFIHHGAHYALECGIVFCSFSILLLVLLLSAKEIQKSRFLIVLLLLFHSEALNMRLSKGHKNLSDSLMNVSMRELITHDKYYSLPRVTEIKSINYSPKNSQYSITATDGRVCRVKFNNDFLFAKSSCRITRGFSRRSLVSLNTGEQSKERTKKQSKKQTKKSKKE
ncbi:MAG: hypothetical protein HQK50_02330 [Oligoflexia bacterium]|nr:hypothetical protein [Oligoflexia bacterium]MBF0364376.1 hypothetical protein [Oligoflexia bacterium]